MQLKALESLGRLREKDAVPILRELLEAKKMWDGPSPRIAHCGGTGAGQDRSALWQPGLSDSGLETGELAIAPLDSAPACPWVRQRRYERIVLPGRLQRRSAVRGANRSILIRELSLGGGMGTKEDNLRIGSEANTRHFRRRASHSRDKYC